MGKMPDLEPGTLQVGFHHPGDLEIVLDYEDGLGQGILPCRSRFNDQRSRKILIRQTSKTRVFQDVDR
jgi:hypothetical protein